ncbi:Futalosine hydrolase [Paenibacillus tyrfis]|uniref:futalosine hydrolase n=1 Tax=Paenibacillus tyrfis TaxID=1501230 RepID=UPI00249106B1|nr:futalosine hydrolase [Paenibacillus tyrfis]GLI04747.1 Futalosine hydrolase [Paenibacillus tyrfis]
MGHEIDASREQTGLRVLVIAAVPAERDAVLRGLRGDGRFDVVAGGVGPAAAAASAAKALAAAEYGLVVSAGIGGGFPGRAEVGSLVVADAIVAADLGAETPEGFRSVDELGFGSSRIAVDASLAAGLTEALQRAGLPALTGPVLTVSTVTGTAATASELAARVPGAAAEAMEGFGVAVAARDRGIPALELRAISNAVGPRDREAWRIKEALDALEAAGAILLEVLR